MLNNDFQTLGPIPLEMGYRLMSSIKAANPNFSLYNFQDKEKIFRNALYSVLNSPNSPNYSMYEELTFSAFLDQLSQTIYDTLLVPCPENDSPFERFLRKLIDFKSFKLAPKQAVPPSPFKYEVTFTYIKPSACIDLLSFLIKMLRTTPEASAAINNSTDLSLPLTVSLRAFAEYRKIYDMQSIEPYIRLAQDTLWTALEEVITDSTMACIMNGVEEQTTGNLFQLFEQANDIEYSNRMRRLLNKLSAATRGHANFTKLNDHFDQTKALLSMWKDVRFFEDRSSYAQKDAFMNFISECLITGLNFKARSLTYEILTQVISLFYTCFEL